MGLEDFSFLDANMGGGGDDYFADDASGWSLPSYNFDSATSNIAPAVDPMLMGGYSGFNMGLPGNSFMGMGAQAIPQVNSAPQFNMNGGGIAPGAQAPSFAQQMMSPQSLLGFGGLAAGLAGALAGGGRGGSVTPQMSMEQRNVGHQTDTALHQLNPFVQGTSPLQQQQMSLLQALASGQGLPPGYAQLVEQAFQPQMGSITQQAIESARRRGFAGGAELLNQGPGGAIAGPALADLQGQMAQAKLGLMQSLPGLYNQPIQTQGNFATQQVAGYNNLMRGYPTGQTQSQPLGPQIGQAIGQGLTGIGSAMGQQSQQQQLLQALQRMQQPQQPGGMSYA